jgi:hypothetical protein
MIRLFDVQNGKVIPTEHCLTLKFLRDLQEEYPQDYLKVYQYLFYMSCYNPDMNPFFDMPEADREEMILQEIEAEFSPEDESIQSALEKTMKLYETPTLRAFLGIKIFMDKMGKSLATEEITYGRDGSSAALLRMAEKYDQVRQSFKGTYKDLQEEQQSKIRGDKNLAYDG